MRLVGALQSSSVATITMYLLAMSSLYKLTTTLNMWWLLALTVAGAICMLCLIVAVVTLTMLAGIPYRDDTATVLHDDYWFEINPKPEDLTMFCGCSGLMTFDHKGMFGYIYKCPDCGDKHTIGKRFFK